MVIKLSFGAIDDCSTTTTVHCCDSFQLGDFVECGDSQLKHHASNHGGLNVSAHPRPWHRADVGRETLTSGHTYVTTSFNVAVV
jgi:hypothetical protein